MTPHYTHGRCKYFLPKLCTEIKPQYKLEQHMKSYHDHQLCIDPNDNSCAEIHLGGGLMHDFVCLPIGHYYLL